MNQNRVMRPLVSVFGLAAGIFASSALAEPILVRIPASTQTEPGISEDAEFKIKVTEIGASNSVPERVDADSLEKEGQRLFQEGQYQKAIERFRAAYKLSQKPDLLYNIAVSASQIEGWSVCLSEVDRFLAKNPQGQKRERGQQLRQICASHVSGEPLLTVNSNPAGAKVFLDDRFVPEFCVTPCRKGVGAGPHQVWVELDRYAPFVQRFEIVGEKGAQIDAELIPKSNAGGLKILSPVSDALILADGRAVGLTPLTDPLFLDVGPHLISIEAKDFKRLDKPVMVNRNQTVSVELNPEPLVERNRWQIPVGWTAVALGALSIGGGIIAWQLAEDEYSDSDKFNRLANLERTGYAFGGIFLAAGAGLLIWDLWLENQGDSGSSGPGSAQRSQFSFSPWGMFYRSAF